MKAIDREKFRESLYGMIRARERLQSNYCVSAEAKAKAQIEKDMLKVVLGMTNNMEFWYNAKP